MSRWSNKYVIGLTGNIAVGKSVVRQMAQHLGAYTIDADGLVHQAMAPGAPAYKPIVQTFGEFILDDEKRINRAMLGSIVFANPEALKKLEAITHPIVRQAINALISRAKQKVVIIEAIKLLEGDLAESVDEVWVVNAKPESQYRRLLEKRKMSPEEAKKRLLAQNAQADKLKKADLVIENDGEIEDTWKQVQAAWNRIQKTLERREQEAAAQNAPTVAVRPDLQQLAAQRAAAVVAPTPAPEPEAESAPSPQIDTTGVEVRRGMPNNAQGIADFINARSGQNIQRLDVMMAFGQKSYLIATTPGGQIIGLMGWTVENLITRVDEFYLDSGFSNQRGVIHALIQAVEAASKELQSEVGFVFVAPDTGRDILDVFIANGYTMTTVQDIKIPAWREAVHDANVGNVLILQKPLRSDRVLTPI